MRNAAIVTMVVAGIAFSIAPARAGEGSSPFSWIGFKKPKTAAARPDSKGPSVFDKMSASTKRFFGGTKKLFSDDKPQVQTYGTKRVHRAEKPKPPQQGFFSRLFNPQPPPPPATIEEWMALDQVHP